MGRSFPAAEQFADRLCLRADGAGWGFLNQQVAVLAMLKGKEYKVNSLFQAHNEACHLGLC